MSRKEWDIVILCMIVISLIGGAVSVRLFPPKTLIGKVVMAEDEEERRHMGMVMKDGFPVFFVLDKEGRKRLMIGTDEEAASSITFLGPYGGMQMILISSILREITGLTLFDQQQNPRVLLTISPNDSFGLGFYDPNKKNRSFFGVGENGEPFLIFADENGEIIWSAPKSIEETKKIAGQLN